MRNYLKKNKPLLFLPLVLIPFIVLIFYVLGGGELSGKEEQKQVNQQEAKGANYNLPDADRNIEIRDKMEGGQTQKEMAVTHDYDILGEKDSLDQISMVTDGGALNESNEPAARDIETELNPDVSNNLLAHIRQKEQQVRNELLEGQKTPIHEEIKRSGTFNQSGNTNNSKRTNGRERTNDTSTQPIRTTGIEELDQVFRQNQVLTRKNDSLNMQNRQLKETSAQQEKLEAEKNKYFALENGEKSGFKPKETVVSVIEAEVYETTTVLTGNRVKLRLLEDAWLNGVKIPVNTFLYGICEVNNERLQVQISQIPVGEKFVPVAITVYDLDGMPGLYVPDNASRRVAKDVGSSANTSSMFGTTNNPLTYAGLQAADRTAQTLLKMIKIKKVTIKKNTLVNLINKNK